MKNNNEYFRDDSDHMCPSVREQIDSELSAVLAEIREKLKPNNYKELEALADSVRQRSEELIIEKWLLREELFKKRAELNAIEK